MRARFALAPLLLGLGACFAVSPRVSVVPSGNGLTAPSKPVGCPMPFLRSAPADRPYDELASLHYTTALFHAGDPGEAQAALRDQACALGADAVLVTREFVPGVPGGSGRPPTMAGAAIRYRSPVAPASR